MRIFKSIVSFLMALCILFSFAGCKKGETEPELEDDKKTEENGEENSDAEITLIGDSEVQRNITVAEELEFYYLNAFNHTYQVSVYYEQQYGEGYGKMLTGYDVTLSPDAQTKNNEAGETITWHESFFDQAIESMATTKVYNNLAVENGIELSEEDEKEIENYISEHNKYGLCGVKFSDEFLKTVLTEQLRASNYQDFCQENIRNKYDDSTITKKYEEDKENYDVASFRWFVIDYSDTAVSEADAFVEKITSVNGYNEETFKAVVLETIGEGNENYEIYKSDAATKIEKIDKDTLETNVSESAANWLFETDTAGNYIRKNGEIKYFVSSDNKDVYILYATGTPVRDNDTLRSVRHILLTDSTKAEAQKVLDEYLAKAGSGVDAEYFIELVNKYSDDSGSKADGGLISDMRNDGQYVSAFEDWAFAEGEFAGQERKTGTTGIVESEYGYHIMFYSSEKEHPVWYEEILENLVYEEWEKIQSDIHIEIDIAVDELKKQTDSDTKESVMQKCLDTIGKLY